MTVDQTSQPQSLAPPKTRTQAERLSTLRKIWPWVFFIAMVTLFTIAARLMNDMNFLSLRGIQGILTYSTQILLVALGETLVIIAAGIDLSVGFTLGLAAVIAAEIMKYMYAAGYSPYLVIPLGMLGGVLICIIPGYINGWLVAKIKVPPFISTFGMGYESMACAPHIRRISGRHEFRTRPAWERQYDNTGSPEEASAFFKVPAAQMRGMQQVYPVNQTLAFVTAPLTRAGTSWRNILGSTSTPRW